MSCSPPGLDGAAGSGRSRMFSEGESENKVPVLASKGLAKWMDPERRFLMCSTCGVTQDTFVN